MQEIGGLDKVLNIELNGAERGEAIDHFALEWIYRFRYSTEYAMTRLKTSTEGMSAREFDQKLRDDYAQRHPDKKLPGEMSLYKTVTQANFRQKLKRLQKTGLIKRFELYIGRSKYGYRLTKAGAQRLQKYSDNYEVDMNNLSGAISPRKASHCIAEQLIVISKIAFAVRAGKKIKYATEKELSESPDIKGFKRPDVLISIDDIVVAYEVELTRKSMAEVHTSFLRNQNFIENGRVAKIVYMLSSGAFKKKYTDALKDERGIPLYTYNPAQKKDKQNGEFFYFKYQKKMTFKVELMLKDFM